MQNDILRPPGRHNTNIEARHQAHSASLSRHGLDEARSRLIGSQAIPLHQNLPPLESHPDIPAVDEPAKEKQAKHHRWHDWSRKQKIIALVFTSLLLAGGWAAAYQFVLKKPPPPRPIIVRAAVPPKPKTVASPLTGVQIPPELTQRPVTGIMMENSLDARPQSGIQDAGVVFEAIAEGGITRFLSLYQEAQPQYIGPVRSLRPYYIDWAAAFDASVAHIGGSPDALAQIRSGGKDLDQFFNAGSYWRQPTRPAPHNVYTSFQRLDPLNQKKGYTASHFTSWPRKDDKKLAVPTAKAINIGISGALYNVHYDYDPATNSYLRGEGGKPHIATVSAEDKTGAQLHPKVVVVMIMSYSLSGKYSVYGTSGNGAAYVFEDGGVVQGTWAKPDRTSQISFTDAQNQPLKLNTGQAWVTALSAANKLTYTP